MWTYFLFYQNWTRKWIFWKVTFREIGCQLYYNTTVCIFIWRLCAISSILPFIVHVRLYTMLKNRRILILLKAKAKYRCSIIVCLLVSKLFAVLPCRQRLTSRSCLYVIPHNSVVGLSHYIKGLWTINQLCFRTEGASWDSIDFLLNEIWRH
jgi:hypothetical protein